MQADKKKVSRLLKTARGQLDGVLKMIEEDRYCIDVSNQIMAAEAILTKANSIVLAAHLASCVKNAEGEDQDQKLEEITKLVLSLLK